jgi:hypothetical protein
LQGIEHLWSGSEEIVAKSGRQAEREHPRHQFGAGHPLRSDTESALQPSHGGAVGKDDPGVFERTPNIFVALDQAKYVDVAEATVSSGACKCPLGHGSSRGRRVAGEALDTENRTESEP